MSTTLLSITAAPPSASVGVAQRQEHVSFSTEARALVGNISQNKHLNLIAIWGPARTGKSFFMNTLAQYTGCGVFSVRGGVDPCTVGAYIATTSKSFETFSKGNRDAGTELKTTSTSASRPEVGFVDVEGQGDKHLSYDMLLATPLLLLSKVIIIIVSQGK